MIVLDQQFFLGAVIFLMGLNALMRVLKIYDRGVWTVWNVLVILCCAGYVFPSIQIQSPIVFSGFGIVAASPSTASPTPAPVEYDYLYPSSMGKYESNQIQSRIGPNISQKKIGDLTYYYGADIPAAGDLKAGISDEGCWSGKAGSADRVNLCEI